MYIILLNPALRHVYLGLQPHVRAKPNLGIRLTPGSRPEMCCSASPKKWHPSLGKNPKTCQNTCIVYMYI